MATTAHQFFSTDLSFPDSQIQPLHACLQTAKIQPSFKIYCPQIYQFILHLNEYDLSKISDPRLHYLTPLSNWSSFLFFPMPLHQSHLTDIVSIKVIFLVFLSHIYMQTNYNLYSPYISLNSLPLSAIISQILRVPPEHFKRFPAQIN